MINLFLVIMVIMAIWALEARQLVSSVIMLAVFSLIMSLVFYYLKAPDIAMAEAAVGAGMSTVVFMAAIYRTRSQGEDEDKAG